jgi:hypothetical protein
MRYFDPTLRLGLIHNIKVTPLSGDGWSLGPIAERWPPVLFTKMIARCPLWVTADISLEERHEEHIQTVDDKYQGWGNALACGFLVGALWLKSK